MLRRIIIIISTLILLLNLCIINISAKGEGTSGANFLKIGTSARAEALGGAIVALVDDIAASYYNPAGLTHLSRSTLGFTHLEWFEDIRYEFGSYAFKNLYLGAVALNVGYLYLGDIPKTLEGLNGDLMLANTSDTFKVYDVMFNLSWAKNFLFKANKLGINIKILNSNIDATNSMSLGLDIGEQICLYQTEWHQKMVQKNGIIRIIPSVIGFSIKNLGTPTKFFEQSDSLPLISTCGLAYKLANNRINFSLDYVYHHIEKKNTLNTGLELGVYTTYDPKKNSGLNLMLRGGYRTGYNKHSSLGFSTGLGMKYAGLSIDYAYIPFIDLGITHRISLEISWGELLSRKKKTPSKSPVKVKKDKPIITKPTNTDSTVKSMVESKKNMQSKLVVKKEKSEEVEIKTKLTAKKPTQMQAEHDIDLLINRDQLNKRTVNTTSVAIGGGAVIKGSTKINKALIAQITSKKKKSNRRARESAKNRVYESRNQYLKRSKSDVARAARNEAQMKNEIFNAVESAAKKEAKQRNRNFKQSKLITKTTVYFAKNTSNLNKKYFVALDKIAMAFDRYPKWTILLYGYTSEDEKNHTNLSLRRIKAVRDYLIQIKSVPADKILFKKFGKRNPVGDNATKRGRALNRRVRVQLIKKDN